MTIGFFCCDYTDYSPIMVIIKTREGYGETLSSSGDNCTTRVDRNLIIIPVCCLSPEGQIK